MLDNIEILIFRLSMLLLQNYFTKQEVQNFFDFQYFMQNEQQE